MNYKNYFFISGVLFGLVALLHLWRAFNSLPLVVGTWELPVWLSWVAFIIVGFLSYWGFKLSRG